MTCFAAYWVQTDPVDRHTLPPSSNNLVYHKAQQKSRFEIKIWSPHTAELNWAFSILRVCWGCGNVSLWWSWICWGAESVEYVLRIVSNLNIIFVHITTVDMKMLFNSAANPLCVCPPELSVQTRGQGNDVLHTPCGTQALSWNGWRN